MYQLTIILIINIFILQFHKKKTIIVKTKNISNKFKFMISHHKLALPLNAQVLLFIKLIY